MNIQETEYTDLIKNLSQLKSVIPGDRFKSHVKSTLIPSLPIKPNFNHMFFFGHSFRIAAIILAFLLLSSSGIVLAASESKPGSLLYPVKQVVQDAKLAITTNPTARALLHLEKAQDKVEEMQQTVFDTKTNQFEQNAQEYKENIKKAVEETKEIETQRENTAQTVNTSLEKHTETLQQLQTVAPTQAQPALEKAIDASQKGQQQVQQVIQNNPAGNTLPTYTPPTGTPQPEQNHADNPPLQLPAQSQNNQNNDSSFGLNKANDNKNK